MVELKEQYVARMQKQFPLSSIQSILNQIASLRVMVIGDAIIDHYVYTQPKGRAVKDPILSVEYRREEIMAGGIFAIANHVSDFVKSVECVTILGEFDEELDFIKSALAKNVKLTHFNKKNSPTNVKKRYIDQTRNTKLFKIEYMNDHPLDEEVTAAVTKHLKAHAGEYDLVIIGDFGHGFINAAIRQALQEYAPFLAGNVQSNSANMGYNYINNYTKLDFLTMDEQELRLPLQRRFEPVHEVMKEFKERFSFNDFMVTRGREGSEFITNEHIFHAPILTTSVKDTIGAGDALFSITALFYYVKAPAELIPFIANTAGGIAVNIVGNKESVTKEKLLNFIEAIYAKPSAV